MDTDAAIELMTGWASLIGAISWPLAVVFVLLYFGRPLRGARRAEAEDAPRG